MRWNFEHPAMLTVTMEHSMAASLAYSPVAYANCCAVATIINGHYWATPLETMTKNWTETKRKRFQSNTNNTTWNEKRHTRIRCVHLTLMIIKLKKVFLHTRNSIGSTTTRTLYRIYLSSFRKLILLFVNEKNPIIRSYLSPSSTVCVCNANRTKRYLKLNQCTERYELSQINWYWWEEKKTNEKKQQIKNAHTHTHIQTQSAQPQWNFNKKRTTTCNWWPKTLSTTFYSMRTYVCTTYAYEIRDLTICPWVSLRKWHVHLFWRFICRRWCRRRFLRRFAIWIRHIYFFSSSSSSNSASTLWLC